MTPPLVAVLDYGIGNLRSAEKGLARVGADARLTADPAVIAEADGVVLPGVGAFGRCMDRNFFVDRVVVVKRFGQHIIQEAVPEDFKIGAAFDVARLHAEQPFRRRI